MKTYTSEEVDNIIGYGDVERDNEGQLILYTSIYAWQDGSYHDEAESSFTLLSDEDVKDDNDD
jgi:hypothetical protein